MKQPSDKIYDLAGIGIGPSNLSVAALLQPLEGEYSSIFFDQKPEFRWHPGMLFPEATLQVSFLKDLVSLVDPTNPYSFLAYLRSQKRLYHFLNAQFAKIKRREFNAYFSWVCEQLDNLHFNTKVTAVTYKDGLFHITAGDQVIRARNFSLGCGLTPAVPPFAQSHRGKQVFHGVHYLDAAPNVAGKRVAIIGGGQSGAEILYHLVLDDDRLPKSIHWVSQREYFSPIDDSPFTNDYFTPPYSDYFFGLPNHEKQNLIQQQTLFSDGIEGGTLTNIYQRLYELRHLGGRKNFCHLLPGVECTTMSRKEDFFSLHLKKGDHQMPITADFVILATGFSFAIPRFLDSLLPFIHMAEDKFVIRKDFSLKWTNSERNSIFLLNGARHVRGVADPNLSLLAWRSATIINSLVGREVYDLADEACPFDFKAMENGAEAASLPSIQIV
ncbi:MAG: SidA/IucD/PvdA family monooxygenase [Bacteroidota bacterium]